MKTSQFSLAAFGWVLTFLLCWLVLSLLEPPLLQSTISPAAGMSTQTWMDRFMSSQVFGVGISLVLAMVWLLLGMISSGRHSDHRLVWVVFWLIAVTASLVLCALMLPVTQQGSAFAYSLAFLNGLLPLWLASVWCTPGACKYAPLGAVQIRGRWGR